MKLALACALCLLISVPAVAGKAPAWRGHAANEQHTAAAPAMGQRLAKIHWSMAVDLAPPGHGVPPDEILIHYAAPMITGANTVLVPVKTTSGGNFQIDAVRGANGHPVWTMATDYTLPPHDWTPPLPAHLTAQNRLYFAGDGGTVYFRDSPDLPSGNTGQIAFFGWSNYQADPQAYNTTVMIDTPITADNAGNIYFGFLVTGSNPLGLTSGIARIDTNGNGTWIGAGAAANDSSITQVAMNCAPAISVDQSTIYIAVSNGSTGYLVGLDAATLAPKSRARLYDPAQHQSAWVNDDSSAAPTIGPDGDVYYGVLESDFPGHNCRGWLLHFSADLTREKTPGSFGWDNTVAVVPANLVPPFSTGNAYYLMSKYNNYYGCGSGDGHNRIAILDPHLGQDDTYSSAIVMKEVKTILSPNQVPGEPAGAVYEWCINSAVVDAQRHSVIANAEDGYSYRWDLASNTLAETLLLNAPLGEAYTPTLIGPDGTVYAINDATLYAIGD